MISVEEELQQQLRALRADYNTTKDALSAAEKKAQLSSDQIATLEGKIKQLSANLATERALHTRDAASKTRLEADLAKARQQIGEKAWKEIFPPEVKP